MCTALIRLVLAVSVGSVHGKTGRPLSARRAAIAARSSVMCTALTTVTRAVRGSSVKDVWMENVAVTARAWLIVTEQVPVPVHAPLQPVKAEPVLAAAVSVTTVPLLNENEQVAPQLIP